MTARSIPWRGLTAICLATALPILAGCGPSKGDISGKVMYKGAPLPTGHVQFQSPAGAFVGEIGPDGSYTVKGVPTGSSKISITCQKEGYAEHMIALSKASKEGGKPPPGKPEDFDLIPTKYTDFTTSGLSYDVKSGENKHDIELK